MTISKQSRLSRWREFAQGLTTRSGDSSIAELAARVGVSRSIGSALKWAKLYNGQPQGELLKAISDERHELAARLSMRALAEYNRWLAARRQDRNARISQAIKAGQPDQGAQKYSLGGNMDELDEKTCIAFLKSRGYEIFKTERIQY